MYSILVGSLEPVIAAVSLDLTKLIPFSIVHCFPCLYPVTNLEYSTALLF